MRYGSVCSGIEAATTAWHPLGWEPAFFSEIEAFPSAVLKHRHPNTPNLGDMTQFQSWPYYAISILVGGTPCQSFSVAGLRKGLADPRGNLMLTFGAIAAKYRPGWLVWENVPGVLSSDGGRDFASFLGLITGQIVEVPAEGWQNSGIVSGIESAYGVAYRVLDAQYVRVESHARAVPQRRRRVFVVGYLGDWRRAAAVLFERESLCGHPAPRRRAGEGTAGTLGSSFARRGYDDRGDTGGVNAIAVASTLDSSFGRLQGCSGQDAKHGHSHLVAFGGNNTSGPIDAATACRAKGGTGRNGRGQPEEICPTLNGSDTGDSRPCVATTHAVRRLTPMECERLQAFPDNYTKIPNWDGWRKMDTSETPEQCISEGMEVKQNKKTGKWRVRDVNGPRYKALGNSMAVNCMRWIGDRIAQVEAILPPQPTAI